MKRILLMAIAALLPGLSTMPQPVQAFETIIGADFVELPEHEAALSFTVANWTDEPGCSFSLLFTNRGPNFNAVYREGGVTYDFVVLREGQEIWRYSQAVEGGGTLEGFVMTAYRGYIVIGGWDGRDASGAVAEKGLYSFAAELDCNYGKFHLSTLETKLNPQAVRAKPMPPEPDPNELLSPEHWANHALDYLCEAGFLGSYDNSHFGGAVLRSQSEIAEATAKLEHRLLQEEDIPPHVAMLALDLIYEFPLQTLESEDLHSEAMKERMRLAASQAKLERWLTPGYGLVEEDALAQGLKNPLPTDAELIPAGNWVYPALVYLQDSGMLEGYPADFFDSGKLLSIYQMQQAIARLDDEALRREELRPHQLLLVAELEGEYPSGGLLIGKSISERILERVIKSKLFADIRGYSQFLKVIETDKYDDLPTDHWAYKACAYFVETDLLEGYPEGFFSGGRLLTRYEFAQVVARLMDTVDQTGADNLIVLEMCTFEGLKAEFAEELKHINLVTYGH